MAKKSKPAKNSSNNIKKSSSKKSLSNKNRITVIRIASGVLLLVVGFTILISLYLPKIYAIITPEPQIRPIILQNKDFWIVIPKIRVDSPILPVITKDSLRRGVGHLPESGYPGQGKNVIIAGHNYDPAKWIPQTTFGLLYELKRGDDVWVAYQGKPYHYVVESSSPFNANSPDLYAKTKIEQLTLLTCMPYENATQRLKVIALPKD